MFTVTAIHEILSELQRGVREGFTVELTGVQLQHPLLWYQKQGKNNKNKKTTTIKSPQI